MSDNQTQPQDAVLTEGSASDVLRYGVEPCAGPAYPNHSKPCPDNIYVVTGKGWCRKCLPRTNIA